MARAGAGKLVGVNEESPVGIAGVDREHPVVHILLGALALVAGGEESAGGVGVETGLQPGGLGVVVVSVSVSLGDVLQDDPPVSLNVHGARDLGVVHVAGAEVALGPDPVAGVVGRGALGGTAVVLVVEAVLLGSSDVLNKVISGLISNISVLLEEEGVLRDLVGNVVGGVLGVEHAVGQVGALGALGRGLGVTVASVVGGGSRVMGGGMVGGGAVGHGGPDGYRYYQ